jgi:L-amino acid N-acyltransferase YncA
VGVTDRLHFRDTEPADLAAITAIYGAEVTHGLASFEEVAPDLAEMTRRWRGLTGEGYPHRVCTDGDRVLGYAYASAYRPRPAYRRSVESTIYLAADARGQGIGRRLLADLVQRCEAGPWRQMIAVIGDSGNLASIGLHQSMGFRLVGTLTDVGFKHGRWVDTVLMQRALGSEDIS